ncbi:MAG: extracellular solute-binding protein [Aestuariivirga sp.]
MSKLSKITASLVISACAFTIFMSPTGAEVLSPEVKSKLSGELVWHDASGGATTRAREETVIKDFVDETGLTVKPDFNSDMTKFFAAMESGASIPWSLIEFPTKGDYLRARDAGYLEKLDTSVVDTSKLGKGAFDEFGVDVMRYGIVFTYNTDKFTKEAAPTSIRDLYDVKKYPGKRCLFKYPQFGGVVESALIADGVEGDKLYPLDLDRAFKKLDTIKSEILWWSNGDDAIRLMSSGECSMGIAWSGRVYNSVKNDKAPLAMVWKDSLYAQAVYAVPKGAPNAPAGQAMIAHFIGDTEGQKSLVQKITYTTDIVGLDATAYGDELAPWIVAGENADSAIVEDAAYYSKNISEVVDKFNRWVALN